MALAIDSKYLVEDYIDLVAYYLGLVLGNTNRFHACRISAHATVIHDNRLLRQLMEGREFDLVRRGVLDWQPDQDDDLDEVEVLHHLQQQAKTSPFLRKCSLQTDRKDATTTLLTSCTVQSPSLPASAQGRPLSSFHRYSLRQSTLAFDINVADSHTSNIREVIPSAPDRRIVRLPVSPRLVREPWQPCVTVWQLQVDIVDFSSPRSPGKRRRTTLNPFHQVSSPPVQKSSPANHLPHAKRFRGVRQREERKTWAAEMKPPKQSKVSFGEFRSEAQAARAIDAAYHYYDKPHLLNFPDTPRILSTRPSPAGVLDEKDKLRFVKEQVKWLASIASTLPSSPPRMPFEIPKSSSKGCTAGPSGFRSVGKLAPILSLSDGDEADDAISQARPSLHEIPTHDLLSNGSIEPNFVGTDVGGAFFPSEEQRSMFPLNSEYALVDSYLSAQLAPSTSVRITDGWDHGAEHSVAPSVTNFENSTQPSFASQELWVNDLAISPPASMIPMPSSPCNFGNDIEPILMEQDSFADAWISGSSAEMSNAWNSFLRD